MSDNQTNTKNNKILKVLGTFFLFAATLVVMLLIGAYFVMLIMFKGPSEKASHEYVVKMTDSGCRNLVELYLSEDEINNIINDSKQ